MKRVTRISRIRGLGVFRDFDWSSDLPEFQQYNVIYGWNGSGKTLLSRIFAGLQNKQAAICQEVVVKLSSGEEIRSQDFPKFMENLAVRVFNRDFVEESVYKAEQLIQPIYVFGPQAKEKQQELDAVSKHIQKVGEEEQLMEEQRKSLVQQRDRLCSEGAKLVREALSLTGRQYEREQFYRDIETLIEQGDTNRYVLDEQEKQQLHKLLRTEQRRKLNHISFSFESQADLFRKAKELCARSIIASVIEELRDKPDVNVWVEQGLKLHRKHGTAICLFCNQALPNERLCALEAHFSKEYEDLIIMIDQLTREVEECKEKTKGLNFPDGDLLYPDLQDRYREKQKQLMEVRERFYEALDHLEKVLKKKRDNPFQNFEKDIPSLDVNDQEIAKVNEIIGDHNKKVENHDREMETAKNKLKFHIIAEKVPEYRQIKTSLDQAERDLVRLKEELENLEKKRQNLERDLAEHRRPAEELNRELKSYLGHSEIQFEVEETGYRIVRNGQPAKSLSEGEKTAIAFLYFLKSLEDREFDVKNGIVVIDDPVSSLDSTALYHAFGFMKSRVKDAGQLFILTHNFLFFRLVKDWFRYLNKRDVAYYMLEVVKDRDLRNSKLVQLDPLLQNYESEYHYLFSLVYRAANGERRGGELSQYYYLPNVIRRLLEAFLEFKVPGKESIYNRLGEISFDPAKKERIRRFCDTHSHSRVIDEPEQDPVILGEAPSVAKDVMDLIQAVDEEHFSRMKQLVDEHE